MSDLVGNPEDRFSCDEAQKKVRVRLCRCSGWSLPLLFAYVIRHVFSWPGSVLKLIIMLFLFYVIFVLFYTILLTLLDFCFYLFEVH